MKYYKYLVYNYTIKTNYPCKYLHPLKTEALDTQKEILIEINDFKCDYFPNLNPSKGNFIYKINNIFFAGSWNEISFVVNWKDFSIYAKAKHIDDAYLFLLNIPLALLLASDNKLILHCSCLLNNREIIGFSGSKGSGKSTLSALLSSENRKLFSDDSICIDVNSKKIHSNNTVEKFTQETVELLKIEHNVSLKNDSFYQNKYIKKLDCFFEGQSLNSFQIYFIFRGKNILKKEITSINAKIDLLTSNIIGYRYANKKLKDLISENIKKLIDIYNIESHVLYIPSWTNNTFKTIISEIEQKIIG